jgi:SAM-dependent methyltransferase
MPEQRLDRRSAALARLYDLDLAEEPGDVDLYRALAQRTGGPILEIAVGTARVAVPLAEAGHRVVGVDLDPAMLARARSRASAAGVAIELVHGDLTDIAALADVTRAGPYRLAIFALNSILLVASADAQRAALASMATSLAPGGLAVVDCWLATPADLGALDGRLSHEWLRTDPETGLEVTKTVAAWYDPVRRMVTLTSIFDEGDAGQPPVRWTRQDPMRLVTVDELASYAQAAGLQIERLAGDYDLRPLDAGSDRVVLVARKPG